MSLTALFTGSSGLQANSEALDVIGNNIANLNTTGFKTQSANFKDLVYQTLSPGSAPTATTGGTDPAQEGFGVGVGTIANAFTQGSVTPTGTSTDAAIQGNGFFVVSDGTNTFYTRNGAFDVDSNGYLVDPNTGDRVQRTGTVGEGTATQPGFQVAGDDDIKVPFGAGAPGAETTTVNYQGNLSSTTAVGGAQTTSIQVYDSQGTAEALNVTFTNTAANTYSVTASISGGGAVALSSNQVTFDSNGVLLSPASITATVTGLTGAAAQAINLNLGTPGQATGLTQFGGSSNANAVSQDGSASGTLTSISFNTDGTVEGQFSNGTTLPLAQLAVAGFNNSNGLLLTGSNYYQSSPSSGQALVGTAGTSGLGTVQGGALEGSNVDISTEFSKLIIAERGFQANAETITVADNTLQTLVNIIH
jgi:flagellar hook protein FlgE